MALEELTGLFTDTDLQDVRKQFYKHEVEMEQVLQRSFPNPGDADKVRKMFADDLGVGGGYVRVSLVAELASRVVGHILFSDLPIITEAATVPALALAPMAVVPGFQNQGIGSALVRRGLDVCKDEGHRIVVVVGHPHFYPRFGFSARVAAHLDSPFSGGDSFMALELAAGALDGVQGRVEYPPPFASFE